MNLLTVLDMVASALGERQALGRAGEGPTYAELLAQAGRGGAALMATGTEALVFVGESGPAFASAFFSANYADVPLVPLNYRLPAHQLRALIQRNEGALVVAEERYIPHLSGGTGTLITTERWLEMLSPGGADPGPVEVPQRAALHLFTSGTTAEPKAAVLGHRHLGAYILASVDFAGADEDEAALVSVPPYHIAGVANLLSNVFSGRRIIYLNAFDPALWLDVVRHEGVTQAMVVPTMLARIVEELGDAESAQTPTLRTISYGGARMPLTVLERALRLFPETGFVNAYGLTETSSSIAVLGPEDHRAGREGSDPAARLRLSSVGRALPGIEIQIRTEDNTLLPAEAHGEIWVRGEQISGRYAGGESGCDAEGWFSTRDAGWLDAEGYLFVEGRTDDTIIRGGENIAPAEIEGVLLSHPAILDAAVVGLPDEEWGQRIGAVVVLRPGHQATPEEISSWSRQRLRGSKAAEVVVIRPDLPRTDTGKLLRRQVLAVLTDSPADSV